MDRIAASVGWPGTLIGFERQWRQRTAGLRNNVLVAVGAVAFAELGLRLGGTDGGTRIIALVVSAFRGSGQVVDATLLTAAVLGASTLLRPLGNWVNRRPLDAENTEALYRVHATSGREAVPDLRDLLDAELARASYPVREIETLSDTPDGVELAAVLVPTTADGAEVGAVAAALERSPLVRTAIWNGNRAYAPHNEARHDLFACVRGF